jgi:dTDP-4-amino-4,6-dideoxygalactose transaminase
MYYLVLPSLDARVAFIQSLKNNGIQAVFHYVPLHSSPMGLKVARAFGELNITEELSSRIVRLPLWLGIEERLDYIIEKSIAALNAVDH